MKIKQKNKKGFTLVELLASIVILGIIMMIALVSVDEVNEKSALSASISSAKNYIRGIEYKYMSNPTEDVQVYRVDNNNVSDVLDSGEIPEDGIVSLVGSTVLEANLCVNGNSLKYEDGNYTEIDSDIFCHYKENAILANLGGTSIDSSSLTVDTKVIGISYRNPRYDDYLALSAEEKSKIELIPSEILFDTREVEEAKENVALAKSNNNNLVLRTNNRLTKINKEINNRKFALYNVEGKNYVTDVEDQGFSGVCWAYAANGAAETTALMKDNLKLDFSETELDYFSRDIPSIDMLGISNPYFSGNYAEKERSALVRGGNNLLTLKSYFSGLTTIKESVFGANSKHHRNNENDFATDKRAIQIFNSKRTEYYIKEINYMPTYFSSLSGRESRRDLDKIIKQMKNNLVNNGGITVGVCGLLIEEYTGNQINGYETGVLSTPGPIITASYSCGNHMLLVVGWDDDITYTDSSGITHTGAWIAKNSHGTDMNSQPDLYADQYPYLYIMYDYYEMYTNDMLNVVEIDKKEWDNSYDSYNNGTKVYNKDFGSAFYFEKIDGVGETISNLGLLSTTSIAKNNEIYIIDVEESYECQKLKISDYTVVGDSVNKKDGLTQAQKGIYMKNGLTSFGYKFFDVSSNYEFKNNYCVLTTNDYDDANIFTNDVQTPKVNLENALSNISGDVYTIDTITKNLVSGREVNYVVKDANGRDVTSSVKISNNYVVNNISHTKIKLPDTKKYTIISKIGAIQSNSLVINDTPANDSRAPECNWLSTPSKVSKTGTASAYIVCTDDYRIATTTIDKDDISAGFLKLNVKSIKLENHTGKTAKWKVTLKRNPLAIFGGNVTLKLKSGTILDATGKSNKEVSAKNSIRVVNLLGK